MKKILNVSLVLALILAMSCGSSDISEIKEVSSKYLKAMSQLDFETAKKYGTSNTQSMLSIAESASSYLPEDKLKLAKREIENLEFEDVDIDGNKAVVHFSTDLKKNEKLRLKKVNGKWKVNMSFGF